MNIGDLPVFSRWALITLQHPEATKAGEEDIPHIVLLRPARIGTTPTREQRDERYVDPDGIEWQPIKTDRGWYRQRTDGREPAGYTHDEMYDFSQKGELIRHPDGSFEPLDPE